MEEATAGGGELVAAVLQLLEVEGEAARVDGGHDDMITLISEHVIRET